MIRTYVFFIALLTAASSGISGQTSGFTYTLEGTLNNQKIVMYLSAVNNTVTGKYFLLTEGTDNDLSGNADAQGNIVMNHMNGKKTTGVFNGVLRDSLYSGSYTAGSSSQPFSLRITSGDYTAMQNAILEEKYAKYTGSYEYQDDVYGNATRMLNVQYTSAGNFNFSVSYHGYEGNTCNSNFAGKGNINSYGIGYYVNGTCELRFYFMPDRIQLDEEGCTDYYQQGCTLGGTYLKLAAGKN